jgi:hypothetical protein
MLKKNMKTRNLFTASALIALLLASAHCTLAASDDVIVTKKAVTQIKAGEVLEVTILVQNNVEEITGAEVREYMIDAETIEAPQTPQEVAPQIAKDNRGGGLGWFDPYYKWIINLGPGEEKTLTYKIRPRTLGPFSIGPTEVVTNKGTYLSNPVYVTVKCNANKVCEGGLKENSINCPEDCPTGFKDSICNAVQDGICDPDCPQNMDLDCIKPACPDAKCEEAKGENYQTCPQDCKKPLVCGDGYCDQGENYGNCAKDCPSGGTDGYCDAVKDAKCDPDCPAKIDPDCSGACGNGVCEIPQGENRRTCPRDCPSGIKDGYCDAVTEGVCDPDCPGGTDSDCTGDNTLAYIIIAFVTALVVLFIYARLRKK